MAMYVQTAVDHDCTGNRVVKVILTTRESRAPTRDHFEKSKRVVPSNTACAQHL